MDEIKASGVVENGSSSDARPPKPLAGSLRQCITSSDHVPLACKKSLVRHQSLVSFLFFCSLLLFSNWVFLILYMYSSYSLFAFA